MGRVKHVRPRTGVRGENINDRRGPPLLDLYGRRRQPRTAPSSYNGVRNVKHDIDGLLGNVGKELTGLSVSLDGLERTPEGAYIVPASVLLSMVHAVQQILSLWRKAHSTFSIAMASSVLCREEALNTLFDAAEDGTEH